jgi:hypothetical protein
VNRDFPIFSRIYLFFLLILSLLTLLTSAFQLSILSDILLLNFLRLSLIQVISEPWDPALQLIALYRLADTEKHKKTGIIYRIYLAIQIRGNSEYDGADAKTLTHQLLAAPAKAAGVCLQIAIQRGLQIRTSCHRTHMSDLFVFDKVFAGPMQRQRYLY